ncbi:uncharacterized protein KY384_009100 [Bacidia gigantensis]|uniref:uncharacterized protein n=1 Tax=Bacidia gigantensis TaxID=2732470 RepID=UPI001D0533AC|nr:uncharacterized protein KY384_009100 [Bacidia gigantensis]KAG8525456.1 hypothetical protein KY384_009100 [Bacidia gigantensis]
MWPLDLISDFAKKKQQNLGPGFDIFGLALRSNPTATSRFSAYLEVQIERLSRENIVSPECRIICEGEGAESLSCGFEENLITKVALYVLRCHSLGTSTLSHYRIRAICGIPQSRGLGSSAAAVIAGVMLGNEVGQLNLSKARMFDYCLMIERHPDNIGAALFGGFVGTSMRPLDLEERARMETPPSEPSEVFSDGFKNLGNSPLGVGRYHHFRLNADIKTVVVVPDFRLNTVDARARLPKTYTREDVIFNAQRCALLPALLGQSTLDTAKISDAMQDKLHQPYRAALIPGFTEVLKDLTPKTYPGLLGVSLSGAGPSIVALATLNFELIANAIITKWHYLAIMSTVVPRQEDLRALIERCVVEN